MRGAPTSPTPPDDPIDAAVRAVWLAGADTETPRLRAGFQARLKTSLPAIHGLAPKHAPQSVLWSRVSSLRYTLPAILLDAILLVATWRTSAYQVTSAMAAHTSIYTTSKGERATITLPDGSTVMLNVASRLEVPSDFAAGNRALRLSGEALFTVTASPSAPFTVAAGSSITRVLGTRFVVRHYPTDSATNLAVQDGKVAIQSVVVTAAQQAVVPRDGVPVITPVSTGRFTFASSVLTLDGQSIAHAIPELDRWYNTTIRFGDSTIATRRIGGQFSAGSTADLKEILEMTFGIRVERSGRILTLYSR